MALSGAFWRRPRAFLGRLGRVLEGSWAVLEASWGRLGSSWGVLGVGGASRGLLGLSCGRLGMSWRPSQLDFLVKWLQIDALHLGKQFWMDFCKFFLPTSIPDFQLKSSPLMFSWFFRFNGGFDF